jgi:hypothetical protein
MADLYIDFGGLERARDSLGHVEQLLRHPLDVMNARAGAATGIDRLRSKLTEFGDEWDYGIGRLAKYAGGVGEALEQIRSTFAELDDKLAATFDAEH